MIHICKNHARRILNPIIDWTTDDVWEFIHGYKVPYCKLYDEGFERLGCVGCPMAGIKRVREFERWPTYKKAYIKSFNRMIERRIEDGLETEWKNGKECFEWWMKE